MRRDNMGLFHVATRFGPQSSVDRIAIVRSITGKSVELHCSEKPE